MLRHIAAFELRYWLRSWMLWSFVLLIAAMILAACSSDNVTVGEALSNTLRNAPYVVQNFYALIGLLTLLMATAFVNSAAARDFGFNTHQILFSTPMRRVDFLLGRFLGATLVSVVPMLGVSLGALLAPLMPWADAERFGPVHWQAHLNSLLVFALPNTFFVAALFFAVAVLVRNELVSFAAGLGLLVLYNIADALVQGRLEYERLAALLDPFGIRTFALVTKYWTVAEKNTQAVGFTGLLLWNRLLWLGLGVALFAFAYARFSFAERQKPGKRPAAEPLSPGPQGGLPPAPALEQAPLRQFLAAVRVQFLAIAKSTSFAVILGGGLLNATGALMVTSDGFGVTSFPVTYWVLNTVAGTLYIFVIAMITFYAGLLVFRDRDVGMDGILDALPTPDWLSYCSRLAALVLMLVTVQSLAMLAGLGAQLWHGFHRHQLGLYLEQLFLRDGSMLLFFCVLALFLQALSPNKHVAHLLFIAFLLANLFAWRPLNVATQLVRFAGRPAVTYSDFFGDAPYRLAWSWFTLYWALCSALLAIATIMFWPRGRLDRWRERLRVARQRFQGGYRAAAAACLLLFGLTGAWIFYNTKVLNTLPGPKDLQRLQADYEKAYKPLAGLRQPRLRSVKYAIDIYPETRNMAMRAEALIENASPQPAEEIHFSLTRGYDTTIEIPGARLAQDDARLFYRVYRFEPPLQPGEKRTLAFTVASRTRGFENAVTQPELVQNGTFFNNQVAPRIGYDPGRELTDPNERRTYGLGEQRLMAKLERECGPACGDTYLGGSSDWVEVETVISTTPDQIAIAPGSLVREWRTGDRRYFEYRLDHASLGFYAFISARYEVAREDWNGVKLEVYYLKEHPWNVPRMLNSMRKSLDYFSRNFGPYAHKQARIIEFPRVARFAQAFPGTMPYSESIGFIANIEHQDDIDMVFYVVAHEMAHQWWAHQVIGANMQGGTLLSESLSQYSALMVMEQEYGRDLMRKFLRYEMDRYLASRGRERQAERPLLTVEAEQGYVHYRKASVVLYQLKETIGAAAMNRALRTLVERYGYAGPPYPTSWALIDALRAETPAEYQYLLKDLFEDITLFSNRALEASSRQLPDGRYEVTLELEARKFKADAKGQESEVPLDDWIEIGAFAKPGKERRYGQTLHRERVHLTESRSRHRFTVDEPPDQAGVDPFLLLVDRVPADNLKQVSAGTSSP